MVLLHDADYLQLWGSVGTSRTSETVRTHTSPSPLLSVVRRTGTVSETSVMLVEPTRPPPFSPASVDEGSTRKMTDIAMGWKNLSTIIEGRLFLGT